MSDYSALLDRFQVTELIGRYVDSINHRDWARYADCWAERGIFRQTVETVDEAPNATVTTTDRPINLEAVGRDAVVKLVSNYDNFPWAFQIASGILVTMRGAAEAQVRHVLNIRSNSLTMLGICYDRAVKQRDGVWRLVVRDYRPSYFERGDAPGLQCRRLPDPNYLNLP